MINTLGHSKLEILKLGIKISKLKTRGKDSYILSLNFRIFIFLRQILMLLPHKFTKYLTTGTILDKRIKSAEILFVNLIRNVQKSTKKMSIFNSLYTIMMTL
jgi:hypothetical protein